MGLQSILIDNTPNYIIYVQLFHHSKSKNGHINITILEKLNDQRKIIKIKQKKNLIYGKN